MYGYYYYYYTLHIYGELLSPRVTNLTKIVILRINFIPGNTTEVMGNVSQDICEYRWHNGVVGSCVAHDISCHHRERNTKLFFAWFNWQHV